FLNRTIFLWVLEFTISCLFLGIPYFIDRSRGHIVDEKNWSKSAAPCLRHAGISWHLACRVLLAFLFWTVSPVFQGLWRSYLRPARCHQTFFLPSGEGLLVLLKRKVVVSPF
ncbi:hypothetical protein JOM56_001768, partial [Amanita muscaria]